MNKSKLRSKIIKLRRKNNIKNLKISLNVFLFFLKSKNLNFKNFGGYYPSNYEISDLEILNLLEKKKFNISLPIIKKNSQMDFYKWSTNDPLKLNKFGIPEPISQKLCIPDILLVPLVAYDDKLNRLGYGGGFYDRYIEKIEKKKKILKVGLAFSFQKLNRVPTSSHDKKLDFIITEKGIIN